MFLAAAVTISVFSFGLVGGEINASEPILPLARPKALDPRKVELGRRLFIDPRLSADGTVSCAHCHVLGEGGSDRRARAVGIGGAVGVIRTPTVYNSGLSLAQFWDGRAPTLEAQVDGPLTNPSEMGAKWPDVLARLSDEPDYRARFAAIGANALSREAVAEAIASFERSLVTVDSRFDRYLRGEEAALSVVERHGYQLFKSYGCASCHQGAAVGGNMFQRFSFFGDYFADRGSIEKADFGRYNVTGRDADRFVFKVPSLRLAAINPPYFHDGSVKELATAVRVMSRYQLGREMPDGDVEAVTAFLSSLVGATLAGESQSAAGNRAP